MMRMWSASGLAAVAMLLIGGTSPLVSQSELLPGSGFEETPRIGLGYVMSGPELVMGGAGYWVGGLPGGLGLYVDVKGQLNTPADDPGFLAGLTVDDVEALPGQEQDLKESGWWSANVAVVRSVSPELMLYLGTGYAQRTAYVRYQDTVALVEDSNFGWYWVEDEELSGGTINVLGGGFFRIGPNLALQLGVEARPFGGMIGFFYTFPLQ